MEKQLEAYQIVSLTAWACYDHKPLSANPSLTPGLCMQTEGFLRFPVQSQFYPCPHQPSVPVSHLFNHRYLFSIEDSYDNFEVFGASLRLIFLVLILLLRHLYPPRGFKLICNRQSGGETSPWSPVSLHCPRFRNFRLGWMRISVCISEEQ